MNELIVLDEEAVARSASRKGMLEAMRGAFVALAQGEAEIFPVAVGAGAPDASMIAIKGGLMRADGRVGVKVGTYWPDNAARGLPNHGATTLLLDPQSGLPYALVNVRVLNGIRTAAANAVAVEALARKDASVLAIIGAGHQAAQDVRAICDIRPIRKVIVWNRTSGKAEKFAEAIAGDMEIEAEVAASAETAAQAADIISSATTATAPILDASCIQPGAHISAMGADRAGKMEWDVSLMARAKLFADYPAQSVEIGEFQHAYRAGLIGLDEITSIGDVLRGARDGRCHDDEITVFDSSGIAVQDVAAASAAVENALSVGAARRIAF